MQKLINKIILVLISFNCIFVFLGAYLYPLASIDAVSIWYLKAKAIFLANGNIPIDVLKNSIYSNTHQQYPILISYVYYFFYLIFGKVSENIVAFLNPLAYFLILCILYKLLRKMQINYSISLLLTYIYSMLSPFLAQGGRKHSGDADIFITLIHFITLFLSFKFIANKSKTLLLTIVLLIMISSQIKGEGIFLVSILLFLPLNKLTKILSVIAALVPFFAWRIFIYLNHIPNDFYFLPPSLPNMFLRMFYIVYYTFLEMIKINNWYIFWPIFFIFVLFGFKLNKKTFMDKFVLYTLFSFFIMYVVYFLLVSVDPQVYIPPSIDRILLQLSPFYFYIFARSVQNTLFSKK